MIQNHFFCETAHGSAPILCFPSTRKYNINEMHIFEMSKMGMTSNFLKANEISTEHFLDQKMILKNFRTFDERFEVLLRHDCRRVPFLKIYYYSVKVPRNVHKMSWIFSKLIFRSKKCTALISLIFKKFEVTHFWHLKYVHYINVVLYHTSEAQFSRLSVCIFPEIIKLYYLSDRTLMVSRMCF